jgi:AraC family L-rhamnose operon transcriptional activator RhaR
MPDVVQIFSKYRLEVDLGGFCKFDQEVSNGPHQHNYFEACWVMAGQGNYCYDGRETAIVPGDLLIAGPGIEHEISSRSTRDLSLYFLSFRISTLGTGSQLSEEDQLLEKFLGHHREVVHQVEGVGNFIPLLHKKSISFQRILLSFCLTLIERSAGIDSAMSKSSPGGAIADQALQIIESRLTSTIRIGQVANACGVSERTLRRSMQSFSGRSVAQEISHRRMMLAAHLILAGNSAAECARLLGDIDPAQFCRQFVRVHGISPRQYRSRFRDASEPMESTRPNFAKTQQN